MHVFFEYLNHHLLLCIVQASYNVGGQVISANAIEQSIFGLRTPRIGRVYIHYSDLE